MPTQGMSQMPRIEAQPKFRTPEEELAYLRSRVAERQQQFEQAGQVVEHDSLAKREVVAYHEQPPAQILHETVVMPDHEIMRNVLKLDPETHDTQIEGLMRLVAESGIRNALSVVERMKNPHLEDDLHRALVQYMITGHPQQGWFGPSTAVRRGLDKVLFEIEPQAFGEDSTRSRDQYRLEMVLSSTEQLYAGLGNLVQDGDGFSLEIAVPEGSEEAVLYLSVPRAKAALTERLIASVFPNARIKELRDDYNIFNDKGYHAAAYGKLSSHKAYPIKTADMFEHDPMNLLLASFAKIAKHGEGAALQIVVGDEGDRYNKHFKKILRQLQKGKHLERALALPENEFLYVLKEYVIRPILMPESEKDIEMQLRFGAEKVPQESIERKIKSRVVPCVLRVVTSGPTQERADELLANLKTVFAQYDDPKGGNGISFEDVSWWSKGKFIRDFIYRSFDSGYKMLLSHGEIGTIFHFTAERVTTSRELKKSMAKQAPAPVEAGTVDGITIGLNRYGANPQPIKFGASDRLRHCYVIGQTGTGKTTFIKNMIMQDIKNGEGVAFIDPHGNDIEDVLASVPPERMKDVIYFDPSYTARPMGINMLEYDRNKPEMKTFVVDEVYGIFRKLYSDVPEAFGPMFEQYYRNAVQLVVEHPESGSTFLEVPRVFADAKFRHMKLDNCKNPVIVQFWKKIAEAAGGEASLENVTPYISSKFDVFLANDIMRPIVAQEKSAFDFRQIMDSRKIFLANLSKGRLGDKNAALLGLVLVSKFLQAAFSRVDTPGGKYPVYYLYIDEFQNFATPSISTILSEARKYKLSLTVAHQFIAQLEEDIRDAVIGNVGTKMAMRIGAADAEFLEKQFTPVFSQQDLQNLPNFNAIVAMLVNNVPARPFTLESVKPPELDFSRCEDMRQQSYQTYGRDREEIEQEIRNRYKEDEPPAQKPKNPFEYF